MFTPPMPSISSVLEVESGISRQAGRPVGRREGEEKEKAKAIEKQAIAGEKRRWGHLLVQYYNRRRWGFTSEMTRADEEKMGNCSAR